MKQKTFRVNATQDAYWYTEIEANSAKEALKMADKNHENYNWDRCSEGFGNWSYDEAEELK